MVDELSQNFRWIMMNEIIKNTISDSIKDCDVKVEGEESKYTVHIISDIFLGKSTVEKHKIVYAALDKYIKSGEIHALTIKAFAVDESN
jgi:acid stress-induced BolA-like protein IbaG/YrbA